MGHGSSDAVLDLLAVTSSGLDYRLGARLRPAGAARPDPSSLPPFQVQIAADFSKGIASRLAGAEVPSWPDTEVSFADLQAGQYIQFTVKSCGDGKYVAVTVYLTSSTSTAK